jgi:ABC-type glycerol-3-phosphate transport system substrate-binding protein
VEFGVPPAQSIAALEIQDAWEPEINAALSGQKSVEDALNDAAELIQNALDQS